MATHQYIEQLSKREVTYSKRVQYCLLLILLAALPLLTFSIDSGGLHVKNFSVLIRQFGEIGLSILLSFIIITALVGLRSLWKLHKTARLRAKHEWHAYSLR
ncbi:hypothetical protein [Methylotenera mobilis]|uniref:Uncharacterized protein n=1 Tax=Methylotenera mobilis (strain JLW8 / ATCC BAA-1282 / DSM 17540) TaxID=583345 RepID=C6WUV4_METML|nr:hypothetical protein [Methylotenera mobilis]ACT47703.1 hypothetical protein Mmol_0793 [Methylotenera mobilis JLW8]